MIRSLRPDDAPACDAIIAGLPEWFGNEEGIRECAAAVRSQAGLLEDGVSGPAGFLTFATMGRDIEITWMAVAADVRRSGVGRRLLAALVERGKRGGVEHVLVKTLSDREDPGPAYAQTRAFYLAMGFVPQAELDIWGPENPAQLLAKGCEPQR